MLERINRKLWNSEVAKPDPEVRFGRGRHSRQEESWVWACDFDPLTADFTAPDDPAPLALPTRADWYESITERADPVVPPVHEIEVDGGVILKILKLK